jgi:hypothetical protein
VDFDGDGRGDILTGSWSSEIWFFRRYRPGYQSHGFVWLFLRKPAR